MLRAREALQRERDEEEDSVGRKGFSGKRFVDVGTLREAIRMKGSGVSSEEIEKRFGLRKGVVDRIGTNDVVDVVK